MTFDENSELHIIEKEVFYYSNLEHIELPDKLFTIDNRAFAKTKLKKIFIPKSVKIVEENIFEGVENLVIYLESSSVPDTWNKNWNIENHQVIFNATRDMAR